MKDEVFSERADAIWGTRLDLMIFVASFLIGFCIYVVLHSVLGMPQLLVTGAVVSVMLAYALVVSLVPRLRVRLDQAGDNAYYLGLLFTLVSMSFALYEFGVAAASAEAGRGSQSGVQAIIANFGIALASTISGIFLRVVLHQMRVDPTEVESMTRIALAEASKRVRASLDYVTADLGRFHDEVRQRASDLLAAAVEDLTKSSVNLVQEVARTTKETLQLAAGPNKELLERNLELARLLAETAAEAKGAVDRLRAVEAPPLTLSRRLDKIAKVLESAGDQTERVASSLEKTAESSSKVMEALANASRTLGEVADDSGVARNASIEVLTRLTELAQGLTAVLGKGEETDRGA